MIAQATTVAPISETMVKVRTSTVSICLVETHKNLMTPLKALVAQGIVDTGPGVFFTINVTNLSL